MTVWHALRSHLQLGICVVALVPTSVAAQRTPRPFFEGDPVRVDAPSLGIKGLQGYGDLVARGDSLIVFTGSQLAPRVIPLSALTRIEVQRRVHSPRRSRALTGMMVGMFGTALVGGIACGNDQVCVGGASVLAILVAPLVAGIAAIPPSTRWHEVDVPTATDPFRQRRVTTPACCLKDSVPRAVVRVPAGTAVNISFAETVADTLRRPHTLLLRVDQPIIVDGHTIVASGSLVRAPLVSSDAVSLWNEPGALRILMASVPTIDGQELKLGTVFTELGKRKNRLTASFTPWNTGGHGKVQKGTRTTAYTSDSLTVRVP